MRETEALIQARSHEAPLGEASLSEEGTLTIQESGGLAYLARKPRKPANRSGTPKSLMLTCPWAGARALRVNR